MAISYEPLNQNTDVTTTRTLLHEVIPLTGTIISGTYGTYPSEENIKNYTHGMFQSVYDYPYLSSSANHIFDITLGYDETSVLSGTVATQNSKKINLYNQFSQVLLGYDPATQKVEIFESDLDITDDDRQMKQCFFISFARLLTKDQIKKGSFTLELGKGDWLTPFSSGSKLPAGTARIILQDLRANVDGTQVASSIGGDYGVLYDATASANASDNTSSHGVVFYQAGIVALSSSAFQASGSNILDFASGSNTQTGSTAGTGPAYTADKTMSSASISGTCDALRHRIYNLSYNNSTEINSTIYFCRMPTTKFNYSSNPTFTSGSKIVVKQIPAEMPITFVTTIGLYNVNNELLATAKLSEPLRKDPGTELTLRVRLDY